MHVRRFARRRVLALVAFVYVVSGCGDFKPPPLNPAPGQSGRKHCAQPSDCAGGLCGADGYCM